MKRKYGAKDFQLRKFHYRCNIKMIKLLYAITISNNDAHTEHHHSLGLLRADCPAGAPIPLEHYTHPLFQPVDLVEHSKLPQWGLGRKQLSP